jgi:transposase InsO family protein
MPDSSSPTQDISVFQYLESFYNAKRIHQTLGYRAPDK